MSNTTVEKKVNANVPPALVGKKLQCRVWSSDGSNGIPTLLATKTKKYGAVDFVVKVGGVKRLYAINYDNKGAIKQLGKVFIYDTTFDNATGGLAFHEFPEDVDSQQAYTMFNNSAVRMYVAKGGFPMWYLIVAVIGMVIIGGGLAYTTVELSHMNQQHLVDITDLTSASQKINNLRIQILNLGGTPIA